MRGDNNLIGVKERLVLVSLGLLLILSLGVVSSEGSNTGTIFSVPGCSNSQVANLPVETCSSSGRWFCTFNQEMFYTISSGGYTFDCANSDNLDLNGDVCCPSGYTCEVEGSTGIGRCVVRTMSCSEYTNPTDCENDEEGCFWLNDECVDDPNQFGCGVYSSPGACEADEFNLGQTGAGTDVCGSYTAGGMLIPASSCLCEWDSDNDECDLVHEVIPEFCVGLGCNDEYKCERFYQFGPCVEGRQEVNWTADLFEVDNTAGTETLVPNSGTGASLRIDYFCESGDDERNCGQPIVKLPFFSFINLIVSVLVIFGVYFVSYGRRRGKE